QANFVSQRDKLAGRMTKYCAYLKNAKDEDPKVLPRYLKIVKQLTVLVMGLDPGKLEQGEADLDLEAALKEIKTDAVDQAIEKLAPGADKEAEEPAAAAPPPQPAASAPAPPTNGAASWQQRYSALQPQVLEALKEKLGDVNKLRTVFSYAQSKAAA